MKNLSFSPTDGDQIVDNLKFGLNFNYTPTPVAGAYELVPNPNVLVATPGPGVLTHSLICNDNLEALLALKENYEDKVDFIYIDPPYNTGNKTGFTYKDSFRNKKDMERHSTWLTFMTERLIAAQPLLAETGIIAVSIDDREVHYLRLLLDEIFGEENFIAQMIVDGGSVKNDVRLISVTHECLLVYGKNLKELQASGVKWRKKRDNVDKLIKKSEQLKKQLKNDYPAVTAALKEWVKKQKFAARLKVFTNADARGLYTYSDLSAPQNGRNYDVIHPVTGKPCKVPSRGWVLAEDSMQKLLADDMIIFGKDETAQPFRKLYLKAGESQVEKSVLAYPARASTHLLAKMLGERGTFNNPKNLDYITDIIRLMSPSDGIILDFFAGSGTTGHAVLALNDQDANSEREFILVTNNENNIHDDVLLPRLKAAISGEWLDGTTHKATPGNLQGYTVQEKVFS